MSQASRKKRKRKRRSGRQPQPRPQQTMERGYARARAKDEEARAKLKPLRPGERPTAVTVGAIVAGLSCLAQIVAMIIWFDLDDSRKAVGSVLGVLVSGLIAVGMWRARYWAVLGMQTLLALVLVSASLGLLGVDKALNAVGLVVIIAGAGTLFWFLIKAMARIQMPERPGANR